MKSHLPSILSGDSVGNSTASSSANSTGGFANYSARYQAFLNQQSQRNQRRAIRPSGLVRGIRGLINFAIFVVLFLAILTLFGFGLSRLNGSAKVVKEVSAAKKQSEATVAGTSPSPVALKKNSRNR